MKLSTNTWIVILVVTLLVITVSIGLWLKYSFKRRLIAIAIAEHNKFSQGTIKETSTVGRELVAGYWNYGVLQGAQDVSVPWSAVFMSYIFRMAGAGPFFNYSQRHSDYIRSSVKARKQNLPVPLKGYRPHEVAIALGDLVCFPRQSGITYDTDYHYKSHCDLVVEVNKSTGQVVTIGGNVSNSVSKTMYNIDSAGRITSAKPHVIIKNFI